MLGFYDMQRLGRLFPDINVNVEIDCDIQHGDSVIGTNPIFPRNMEARITVGDSQDVEPERRWTLQAPFTEEDIFEVILGAVFTLQTKLDRHFPHRRTPIVKQWHTWQLGKDEIVWAEMVVKHSPPIPVPVEIGNLCRVEEYVPVSDGLY